MQHDICLLSPGPVRQTCCRVPARLIPEMKNEVKVMLEMGGDQAIEERVVQSSRLSTEKRWHIKILCRFLQAERCFLPLTLTPCQGLMNS